jgi:hypothetical protein
MLKSAWFACAVILLGGCALLDHDGPKGCDGRQTRTANPNGSVLVAAEPVAGASQPPAGGASAPDRSPSAANAGCR